VAFLIIDAHRGPVASTAVRWAALRLLGPDAVTNAGDRRARWDGRRRRRKRPAPPRRQTSFIPVAFQPFALDGLRRPARRHYYGPLRLPLGHLPLPRVTGYRKVRSCPRRARAELGLSSSCDHLLAVPRPLRREVLRHPLQVPRVLFMAFAKSTQARLPLALLTQESLTTLQTSLYAADRSVATPRFRPQPFGRVWRLCCRRPWRPPGPALHRLVIASLSLGYVMPTPSQLWRPSCWTHADPGLVEGV
jgi:hypothetical protein